MLAPRVGLHSSRRTHDPAPSLSFRVGASPRVTERSAESGPTRSVLGNRCRSFPTPAMSDVSAVPHNIDDAQSAAAGTLWHLVWASEKSGTLRTFDV